MRKEYDVVYRTLLDNYETCKEIYGREESAEAATILYYMAKVKIELKETEDALNLLSNMSLIFRQGQEFRS